MEGRAPTAPELLRDFELILGDKLAVERRRRRKADRVAGVALFTAVLSIATAAVMAYSLYGGRVGISVGVVSTGEIRLLGSDGAVRGRWAIMPDGSQRLALMDDRGAERMRLTLLGNGSPGVSLADSRGEGRVVLSLEAGEGSSLTFADGAGRPRTVLGLASNDASTLLFADESAVPRAALGLEADGSAMFILSDDGRVQSSSNAARDTTAGDGNQ